MDTLLRPDVHRMGHAMGYGMAVPAKACDVLYELPAGSHRLGGMAIKTPRRIIQKSMGVLSSFSYVRCQDDQEDKAEKPDPFNPS